MCQKHDGEVYYSPGLDELLYKNHLGFRVELVIEDPDIGCQPRINHDHRVKLHFISTLGKATPKDFLSSEWVANRKAFFYDLAGTMQWRIYNVRSGEFEFFMHIYDRSKPWEKERVCRMPHEGLRTSRDISELAVA